MPRNPFSRFTAQGRIVKILHSIGKAAIAHVWCQNSDLFAARYRHHLGEGPTPAKAILEVRKARKAYEQSENEKLIMKDFCNAGLCFEEYFTFKDYNGFTNPPTRAELRRIVTHPDRKAHNWATYRTQLAQLGILVSKPKSATN